MSTFAVDWLALREGVDAGARAPGLVETLRAATDDGGIRRCIDLGTGTGSALRYLAPRLGGEQHWQLADADPILLGAARRELTDWAHARGADVDDTRALLRLTETGLDCRLRFVETDIAADLDAIDWVEGAIVSASALIDLVSAEWLESLAALCRRGRNPVWLSLTIDGRIDFEPGDALDDTVRSAFSRDQRRDKGFGPALGPEAPQVAREAFAAAGFEVRSETSDWVLDADARRLAAALVEGYSRVAGTVEARAATSIADWRERREAQIDAGGLTIRVGHLDLLAMPPG